MFEISHLIEFFIKGFHTLVDKISYGDTAVKPIVSLFLLGVIGYMSRLVLRKYPMLIWFWIKRKLTVSVTLVRDTTTSARNFTSFMEFYSEHKEVKRNNRAQQLFFKTDHTVVGPADGFNWFRFKGRTYWFVKRDLPSEGSEVQKSKIVIYTYGFTTKPIDELIEAISIHPPEKLGFFTNTGDYREAWHRESDLVELTLDDLIIEPNVKVRLIQKLKWFLENEQWYRDRFLDYKLVIMLYGPPGTGKSYLARAIAHFLNRSIYSLPASVQDAAFQKLFGRVPQEGLILTEDFDDVKTLLKRAGDEKIGEHERSVRGDGVRLSTLLNSLQGVNTSSGRVIVMSTNHLEMIDPAIYRSSRVDLMLEVGPLGNAQVYEFISRMYSPELASTIDFDFGYQKAGLLSQVFHDNPLDFDSFVKQMKEEVHKQDKVSSVIPLRR